VLRNKVNGIKNKKKKKKYLGTRTCFRKKRKALWLMYFNILRVENLIDSLNGDILRIR